MSAPFFRSRKLGTTTEWGTDKTATLASGATFTPLTDHVCDEVTIFVPSTGVSLDIKGFGSDEFVTIDAPSGVTIPVAASTQEILVRRTDQSATPVDVRFSWRKFKH